MLQLYGEHSSPAEGHVKLDKDTLVKTRHGVVVMMGIFLVYPFTDLKQSSGLLM